MIRHLIHDHEFLNLVGTIGFVAILLFLVVCLLDVLEHFKK